MSASWAGVDRCHRLVGAVGLWWHSWSGRWPLHGIGWAGPLFISSPRCTGSGVGAGVRLVVHRLFPVVARRRSSAAAWWSRNL